MILRAARLKAPSDIVSAALGAGKRFSDNSPMPSTSTAAPITCVSSPLSAVDTDLLVVPWFDDEGPSAIDGLDAASGGDIARALASKEFCGKAFELFATSLTDRSWRARRVVLIGAGQSADYRSELARQLAAAAGISVRNRRVERVGFVLRGRGDIAELAQAVAEGLTLSEFNAGMYKTGDSAPPGAPAWTVAMPDQAPDVLTRARERSTAGGCSPNAATWHASSPTSPATR